MIGLDYRPKDGGVNRLLKNQGYQPRWLILTWRQLEFAAYIIWLLAMLYLGVRAKLGK